MSHRKISSEIRRQVEQRAGNRCEYCQTTVKISTQKFEIEHIQPLTKGGLTNLENLALSCRGCNAHKHSRTEGIDPLTQTLEPIFHPRKDQWEVHFAWDSDPSYLIGLTPTGRASIEIIKLNRTELISVRKLLQRLHMHPPS